MLSTASASEPDFVKFLLTTFDVPARENLGSSSSPNPAQSLPDTDRSASSGLMKLETRLATQSTALKDAHSNPAPCFQGAPHTTFDQQLTWASDSASETAAAGAAEIWPLLGTSGFNLRPRDDVDQDPLEPLLEVTSQGAEETLARLRDLQAATASTPVPGSTGSVASLHSTTSQATPDSPLSLARVGVHDDKLQLVVQKLADIKHRLDSLPSNSSQPSRKRQALEPPEGEFCIPASRAGAAPAQPQPRQPKAGFTAQGCSTGSCGSQPLSSKLCEMGLPAMPHLLPSPDFRLQLFKGFTINPMWNELAAMRVDVLYEHMFLSRWDARLPLRQLQRVVTLGQLAELPSSAFCELITSVVAALVEAAPACLDQSSEQSRDFAALTTEALMLYGINGVVRPREILAMLGCHLQQADQRDRGRPWLNVLSRVNFSPGQIAATKQLWASFDIRMARLAACRQQLLSHIQAQEANNQLEHAVSTAPAMIEPAAELMANVRLQQEVLLHTMRCFVYGICTPWQWGHLMAFNYPFHIETMDLIQFVQTL